MKTYLIVLFLSLYALYPLKGQDTLFFYEESDSVFDVQYNSETVSVNVTDEIDFFLKPYLTIIDTARTIPSFFYDINFDLRDSTLAFWFKDIVYPNKIDRLYISLRVELFSAITNQELLKMIIEDESQKKLFENINRMNLRSDQYSNHDLAIMRLNELRLGINSLWTTGLANPARFVQKKRN